MTINEIARNACLAFHDCWPDVTAPDAEERASGDIVDGRRLIQSGVEVDPTDDAAIHRAIWNLKEMVEKNCGGAPAITCQLRLPKGVMNLDSVVGWGIHVRVVTAEMITTGAPATRIDILYAP